MLSMRSCSALIALLVSMPVLGLFLLSAPAYAQSTKPQNGADLIKYSPLNPLPGVAMDTTQPDALATYLGEIYTFIVGFIIIIAFLAFTYGGFQYVLSTTVGSKSEAKTYMVGALAGLVIALASYLILYTINPQLLNFNFITEFQQIIIDVPKTTQVNVTMYTLQGTCANQPGSSVVPQSFSDAQSCQNAIDSNAGGCGTSGLSCSGATQKITVTDVSISALGANGNPADLNLIPSRTDNDLRTTVNRVSADYANQIAAACQSYGANIPDCQATVAALITVESSGNANEGTNGVGATGLMQVLSGNALGCSLSDPACNINSGVATLNKCASQFGSATNAVACYNGGASSVPGTSPSGKTPAMGASNDCPGLYAWQCTTHPGGLVETQKEVANFCRATYFIGKHC